MSQGDTAMPLRQVFQCNEQVNCVQILGQQMDIERMINEYESFTSDLLAWIEQASTFFSSLSHITPPPRVIILY
jgi:hypothetical protein